MPVGKIFLWMNIALLAGIASGSFLMHVPSLIYIIGILSAVIVIALIHRKRVVIVLLCISFVIGVTVFLTFADRIRAQHLEQLQNPEIKGFIIQKSNHTLLVESDSGTVVEYTSVFQPVLSGQRVKAVCTNYETKIDFSRYASKKVIARCTKSAISIEQGSRDASTLESFRNIVISKIEKVFPQPEAGLLAGIVVGDQASLPSDVLEGLRSTATAHIVVLSGYNITVVALFVGLLFSRLRVSIKTKNFLCVGAIWFFVAFTGFGTSSLRAAVMVSLVFIAKSLGRPSAPFAVAVYAAAALCFFSPEILIFSISFQLTFLATLGMLFGNRISPRFQFVPWQFVQETLRTTWAACVMTFPIIAYYFHSLSLIGIIANCLVVPLIPLAMSAGALVIGLSFFSVHFAIIAGVVPYTVVKWIFFCIDTLRHVPFASIAVEPSIEVVIGLYLCLAFVIWLRRKNDHVEVLAQILPRFIKFVAVGCAVVVMVLFVATPSHSIAHISFFDVGQGDAAHIRLQNGFDVLIDGGPDASVVSRLGHDMPYWDRTIELLIITHPHADHVTGLIDVLRTYQVQEIWISGLGVADAPYREVERQIEFQNIKTVVVHQGDKKILSDDPVVSLDVLWPVVGTYSTDTNDTSVVTVFKIENRSILFTGDLSSVVEKQLMTEKQFEQVDVLKVGHHGSNDATSEAFLRIVHPSLAVISVGKNNAYHHPHSSTLTRLRNAGATFFRTDLCSTVSLDIRKGFGLRVQASCALDKS